MLYSPYLQTNNLEWYDPGQITTENGYLKITIAEQQNHNMSYISGMMTTWNKFCFTGGYIEGMLSHEYMENLISDLYLAAVSLPGRPDTSGFWPGEFDHSV